MSASPLSAEDWRLQEPDDVLLRRFGHVRAVGGITWFLVVVVLALRYGWEVWPLGLGVPILAVVTTLYFIRSEQYPRTLVTVSLIADAIVLAGAIGFFGGTGSGLVLVYAIVVVSAGLLLGPSSALGFTALCLLLGLGQLGLEQAGFTPQVLHRPDLSDRVGVLLASSVGLISVGYLSGTYASRLHELIALSGQERARSQARGRRRRGYVRQAGEDVRRRLTEIDALAEQLHASDRVASEGQEELAARLRLAISEVEAAVEELADAAALDGLREARPEPVHLGRVVEDSRRALAGRLARQVVTTDIPDVRVVANRGAMRRIVHNLLENVADHTPGGTRAHVAARTRAGQCLLVVTDDGPGVPTEEIPTLFEPPDRDRSEHVGLPLVRELCEAMGADIRYESAPGSGARFVVSFRLAPAAAPTAEESAEETRG